MSMSAPFDPVQPSTDDGIPAADAGNGAPPPAEGVGGEEPDRPEETGAESPVADGASDTPFRTPDPTEVRPAD